MNALHEIRGCIEIKILLIMQQFDYLISLKTKIKIIFFHWDSNLGSLGQRSSA